MLIVISFKISLSQCHEFVFMIRRQHKVDGPIHHNPAYKTLMELLNHISMALETQNMA